MATTQNALLDLEDQLREKDTKLNELTEIIREHQDESRKLKKELQDRASKIYDFESLL